MKTSCSTVVFALVALLFLVENSQGQARNIIDVNRMGVFKVAVLRNLKPVVVYFTKSSCGQCRQILNELEGIAKSNSETMYLARVDLDQYPELRKEFRITTVPTTRTYYRGALVGQVEGPLSGASRAIANNVLKLGERKKSSN